MIQTSPETLAELDRLQTLVKNTNAQLESVTLRMKSLEQDNETIQEEYTHCLSRNTKLLSDLKQKETQWDLKLQELTKQGLLKSEEYEQALKFIEEQSEQKQAVLKEKIKQLQAQHCQAIDFLQAQLLEAKGEVERLNKMIDELKLLNVDNQHQLQSQQNGMSPKNATDSFKSNLVIRIDDNQKSTEVR